MEWSQCRPKVTPLLMHWSYHSLTQNLWHDFPHRPVTKIPQCTSPISYNAPFCNRNVHKYAHFCYKMVHCGTFVWCIAGFVRWVYWMTPCSHDPKKYNKQKMGPEAASNILHHKVYCFTSSWTLSISVSDEKYFGKMACIGSKLEKLLLSQISLRSWKIVLFQGLEIS